MIRSMTQVPATNRTAASAVGPRLSAPYSNATLGARKTESANPGNISGVAMTPTTVFRKTRLTGARAPVRNGTMIAYPRPTPSHTRGCWGCSARCTSHVVSVQATSPPATIPAPDRKSATIGSRCCGSKSGGLSLARATSETRRAKIPKAAPYTATQVNSLMR